MIAGINRKLSGFPVVDERANPETIHTLLERNRGSQPALCMRNFYDYTIWHQGIVLALDAYVLTLQLPKEEMYGLSSQVKRSAVSVPANIAEGYGREPGGDFKRFLEISLGSAFELETHLIIAERLGFIKSEDIQKYLIALRSEQRQINSLISRLRDG